MATRMLQRRGTAAEWAAQNPVLSNGEIGFETDTKVIKVGDGVTVWNDLTLPYVPLSGGVMTGTLTLVEPENSDHAARMSDVTQHGVPVGGIIMWSGVIENIPDNWALCDGSNSTPDLRGRFIVGSEGVYDVGDTGGLETVELTEAQMPSHNHSGPSHTHASGSLSTGGGGSHAHRILTRSSPTAQSHGHAVQTSVNRVARAPNTTDTVDAITDGNATEAESNHTHSVSGSSASGGTQNTGSSGSGNAHENRPPYYALAYIMRIA